MKARVLVIGIIGAVAIRTAAVPVAPFKSIAFVATTSTDIVIARCVALPTNPPPHYYKDRFYPARMELVRSLKGDLTNSTLEVRTIYPLRVGNKYLLSSTGRMPFGADLACLSELSLVELPQYFDDSRLIGKSLVEQITEVFSARRAAIAQEVQRLRLENELLDKALKTSETNSEPSSAP